VTVPRIGLIGGLSWESTASYYQYLNESFVGSTPWSQPELLIDSLDFGRIVQLQHLAQWETTGEILVEAARRLEHAGATVLAIAANTMHINYDVVASAVAVPVLDVRDAVANEVLSLHGRTLALLGTRYLIENDFYTERLAKFGVASLRPTADQVERLQSIIFDELTKGVILAESREFLREVATSLLKRGADVVGLCCTEFGLLMDEDEPFAVIDSTRAHVRALLEATR